MKWVLYILGTLAAVIALIGFVGMLLPREHVAVVQIALRQLPARVFEVISDVSRGPEWRSDLKAVEILSAEGTPLRWRETTGFGQITMAMEESEPPARLVSRIDDPDQPFGGRWIYELAPTEAGTTLTITERGEVYNPFFRFMSRFVFGHYRMLEAYARDLARRFGETAEPVRLAAPAPAEAIPRQSSNARADSSFEVRSVCENRIQGYAVEYPASWHVNSGEILGPCALFDPDPIEVPRDSEVPIEVAITMGIQSAPFGTLVGDVPGRREISREPTTVDGRVAMRIDGETTGEGLHSPEIRTYEYFVDLGGRTMTAVTYDAGTVAFERKRRILDLMMTTVRFDQRH